MQTRSCWRRGISWRPAGSASISRATSCCPLVTLNGLLERQRQLRVRALLAERERGAGAGAGGGADLPGRCRIFGGPAGQGGQRAGAGPGRPGRARHDADGTHRLGQHSRRPDPPRRGEPRDRSRPRCREWPRRPAVRRCPNHGGPAERTAGDTVERGRRDHGAHRPADRGADAAGCDRRPDARPARWHASTLRSARALIARCARSGSARRHRTRTASGRSPPPGRATSAADSLPPQRCRFERHAEAVPAGRGHTERTGFDPRAQKHKRGFLEAVCRLRLPVRTPGRFPDRAHRGRRARQPRSPPGPRPWRQRRSGCP